MAAEQTRRSSERWAHSPVGACAVLGAAAFALLLACGSTVPLAPSSTQPAWPSPPAAGYALAWQDEFDGASLDPGRWSVRSGVRRNAVNTPQAVSVLDGVLTITTYTEDGVHYTGFVDTAGKYEPTFGYLEARIRFDSSPGEWGAFWLQSPTMGNPIGNVAVAGTEVDIVEHRAHDSSSRDISNTYVMNLHWDGYDASHKSAGSSGRPAAGAPSLAGHWHVYAVRWTPAEWVFLLDGVEQWRSAEAVSKRGEFIRLTCEVADRGWAGAIPAQGYGARGQSATRMLVDWVRVWQSPSDR